MELSFMVIDDSELDCFVARKLIVQSGINKSVKTYFSAIDALADITINDGATADSKTIILLDLIIPQMDGLEFIEEFEKLSQEIQDCYFVIALTASRNKSELSQLAGYKSINAVLEKPLSDEKLYEVINMAFPGYFTIQNTQGKKLQ